MKAIRGKIDGLITMIGVLGLLNLLITILSATAGLAEPSDTSCITAQMALSDQNMKHLKPCNKEAAYVSAYCKPVKISRDEVLKMMSQNPLSRFLPALREGMDAAFNNEMDKTEVRMVFSEAMENDIVMSQFVSDERKQFIYWMYSLLGHSLMLKHLQVFEPPEKEMGVYLLAQDTASKLLNTFGISDLPSEPDQIEKLLSCAIQCDAPSLRMWEILHSKSYEECIR